jgi:hypothetical protein
LKHIQFIAFIKRSAENYLSTMMLKRNICSEHLNIYTEKTVQKHLNFVHSTETVFHLMFKTFLRTKQRFYTSCSFWWNHKRCILTSENCLFENISWEYFINYLLNLVKDSVNHQLHNVQTYTEAVQKSDQSVHAVYLSTLKVQLMLYNEKQLIMHFFTKLQLEIKKILLNY